MPLVESTLLCNTKCLLPTGHFSLVCLFDLGFGFASSLAYPCGALDRNTLVQNKVFNIYHPINVIGLFGVPGGLAWSCGSTLFDTIYFLPGYLVGLFGSSGVWALRQSSMPNQQGWHTISPVQYSVFYLHN